MLKKNIFALFLCVFALPCVAEVSVMTSAEFKTKIFDYTTQDKWSYLGDKPCVIDFYATWCGPCKRLAPIMDELSETYKGKINFYKVDVDQNRELAAAFGISSIPQVLYIPVEGKPSLKVGLYPKEEIIKLLDEICR